MSCEKHRPCQGLDLTRTKIFAKMSRCWNDDEEATWPDSFSLNQPVKRGLGIWHQPLSPLAVMDDSPLKSCRRSDVPLRASQTKSPYSE